MTSVVDGIHDMKDVEIDGEENTTPTTTTNRMLSVCQRTANTLMEANGRCRIMPTAP